jgi:hypothetical protein
MIPITNPRRTPKQTQLTKNIIINKAEFIVNFRHSTDRLPSIAGLLLWSGGVLLPVSARLVVAV